MPPLLLISVRDAAEAAIAIDSGADVIDVKEPGQGSLGRATNEAVASIIKVAHRDNVPPPPVTMALGELQECDRRSAAIPPGVSMLKLGLAGCARRPGWRNEWAAFQADCRLRFTVPPGWAAVIYADGDLAESPSPMDVVRAAAELECRGVLIDTFSKTSGRLLDVVDLAALRTWSDAIHERGMFVALAGSLQGADLPRLADLNPDIVAVRGGVCVHGERRSMIDARRIQEFRLAMASAWPASSPAAARRRHALDRLGRLPSDHDRVALAIRGGE